jgi:transposase
VVYRSASSADRLEAGTHSIWISEQLQELGYEVIVANVRELRAISHSDRKSDQVDAEIA